MLIETEHENENKNMTNNELLLNSCNNNSSCMNDNNFKRIKYTKEFLLLLQERENSKFYPLSLPKCCTNLYGYWDPEKYFDLMKLAKTANQQQQQQVNKIECVKQNQDDIHCSGDSGRVVCEEQIIKLNETKLTNDEVVSKEIKNSQTVNDDSTLISKCLNFIPGSIYEIIFCSINTENNFYVNTTTLISAQQELSIKINTYCNQQQQMYIKASFDDILLAKSIIDGIWYRAKVINSTGSCSTVFSIDNGKTFETVNTLLLPIPSKFKNIPAMAINIGLAGISSKITDTQLLIDFLKRQLSYKIKILFNISDKFYVEVFNESNQSLNSLLNPRFQNEMYGTSISQKI